MSFSVLLPSVSFLVVQLSPPRTLSFPASYPVFLNACFITPRPVGGEVRVQSTDHLSQSFALFSIKVLTFVASSTRCQQLVEWEGKSAAFFTFNTLARYKDILTCYYLEVAKLVKLQAEWIVKQQQTKIYNNALVLY